MTKHNITRVHPVAKLFPLLDDDELAVLAESIKQNGLLTPITRDPNGVLLDGRNRLKACQMAGVEPRFEVYDGDPVEFILSKNIVRRHLNAGQCAVLCALAYPEPRQRGRKSSIASKLETFVPKPQWFSASRLSEARLIVRHSHEMALDVVAGIRPFQRTLHEATTHHVRLTCSDPVSYGTPTRRVTIVPRVLPRTTTMVTLRPKLVTQQRDAAHTEPDPSQMEDDAIEQWLVDWQPGELSARVIEADRLSPGYAKRVLTAISERMGAPPVMMH